MAIRIPLKTVVSSDNNGEVGAGSVAGGVPINFMLPQDTDGVLVKLRASTVGGGVSALFQTTDDGGTTWYDVARTSIVSNTANAYNPEWLEIPVVGPFFPTVPAGSVVATGSVQATGTMFATPRNTAASTLGQRSYSGLPIMGQKARIMLILTGDLTASTLLTTEVKVNDQSATA